MRATPAEVLIGIAAGVAATMIMVCGLIWRLSAWHARTEARLAAVERSVRRLERAAGMRPPGRHRARRQGGPWNAV